MTESVELDMTRMERAMLDTYLRELQGKISDPDRLRAVYGSHFYDADIRLKLNSVCATAAQLLGTPCSSINMIEGDAQVAIATYGGRALERVELNRSYCQNIVGTERDLMVEDSTTHALVCQLLATTEDGIRSYLGVPLMTEDGHILGALCVWDTKVRTWNESHVTMLTSLAIVIMKFEGHLPGGVAA